MEKGLIVINFKNYKIGKEVLDLSRMIEIYSNNSIIALPSINIAEIRKETSLQVWAQHVDYQERGRGTGYLIPEELIGIGAGGSLLNHCEHKLNLLDIKKTVKRCNEAGLKLIICASTIAEAARIKKLKPFAIAFEDNKLIATGKSITSYKVDELKKFVALMEDSGIKALCGAGISSGEDVKHALALGCNGVLVSSAVANSQNPEKFLKEASSSI